jgi:hypothetical protein
MMFSTDAAYASRNQAQVSANAMGVRTSYVFDLHGRLESNKTRTGTSLGTSMMLWGGWSS